LLHEPVMGISVPSMSRSVFLSDICWGRAFAAFRRNISLQRFCPADPLSPKALICAFADLLHESMTGISVPSMSWSVPLSDTFEGLTIEGAAGSHGSPAVQPRWKCSMFVSLLISPDFVPITLPTHPSIHIGVSPRRFTPTSRGNLSFWHGT
jgi:hypothetical protein